MKDYIKEIYTLINTLDRTAEQFDEYVQASKRLKELANKIRMQKVIGSDPELEELADTLMDSRSHEIIMDM